MTKAAVRSAALARRKSAFEAATPQQSGRLSEVLARHRGVPIAGYSPMRTEIDPIPALTQAADEGPVAMPVITGAGQPLEFRQWHPGCEMVPGPFGASVPATGPRLRPEIIVVPLVAFDRRGGRLGYGGGFYDRTLEQLRSAGPVLAIGFAFAEQEAEALPLEPTDQPLDLIVTDRRVIDPVSPAGAD